MKRMDVKGDPAPVLYLRLDTTLFDQVIILVNIQSCLALREKAFPSMFGQPIEIPMLVVLWLLQSGRCEGVAPSAAGASSACSTGLIAARARVTRCALW